MLLGVFITALLKVVVHQHQRSAVQRLSEHGLNTVKIGYTMAIKPAPLVIDPQPMRLSRIFVDTPLTPGLLQLPEQQAHYLTRVLRLSQGDPVQLFDGSGQEYFGQLIEVSKKQTRVELTEQRPGLAESPLKVHLGQVLSKGERFDWALQKATELGVTQITPLFSERCEVRLATERSEKRLAHWRQVVISACEQCGRSKIPQVAPPMPLKDWQQLDCQLKLVLSPTANALGEQPRPHSLALLIGPEGGLTDAEVAAAQTSGFIALGLGPRVLRTETAPLVALSVAQYLWGDF